MREDMGGRKTDERVVVVGAIHVCVVVIAHLWIYVLEEYEMVPAEKI